MIDGKNRPVEMHVVDTYAVYDRLVEMLGGERRELRDRILAASQRKNDAGMAVADALREAASEAGVKL